MLILLALVVCTFVINADAQCYNGWVKFGSSCYGFGEEYVSWAGAAALCRIFDGTLAEIETAAENNFLKEHARNRSCWLLVADQNTNSRAYFMHLHLLWSAFEAVLVDLFNVNLVPGDQDTALWIGATDIFSEGHWIWSGSKQPVQGFTDWAPGEPNHIHGQSSEDCMNLYASEHYQWNDESCKGNFPFVCEVKLEV